VYQNALTELASQISVTVKAESEAIQQGSADAVSTEFQQRIQRLVYLELEKYRNCRRVFITRGKIQCFFDFPKLST
jgi:Holliday junction resolvase-like predicted endonuclease